MRGLGVLVPTPLGRNVSNTYRGVSPTFQKFPTLQTGPKQSSAIAVFIQRKLLSWFFAKASRLVSQFWTKAEVNSTSFSVELSFYCIFTNFFSRPGAVYFLSTAERVFQKRIICIVVSVLTLISLKISNLNCRILFGIM